VLKHSSTHFFVKGVWVYNQRLKYQKYLRRNKPHHPHIWARFRILNEIGFSWYVDIKNETVATGLSIYDNDEDWLNKYKELKAYFKKYGHCLVPLVYDKNPQLGYVYLKITFKIHMKFGIS